jgi:hypothetical protein
MVGHQNVLHGEAQIRGSWGQDSSGKKVLSKKKKVMQKKWNGSSGRVSTNKCKALSSTKKKKKKERKKEKSSKVSGSTKAWDQSSFTIYLLCGFGHTISSR